VSGDQPRRSNRPYRPEEVAPYRNIATGRDDTPVSLFVFDVGLQGRELRSVVLPKVSDGLQPGVPALHIFAMTVD